MKTSETYKKEILEKYKKEKGGEMNGYLAKPTRKQIRLACSWLLSRRKEKNDDYILNQFFQFKEGENKEAHIRGLKGYKADKFVPVIQFLKGKTYDPSTEIIELVSWLIDFQPRPLQEYLKSESLTLEKKPLNKPKSATVLEPDDLETTGNNKLKLKEEKERRKQEEIERKKEKLKVKKRRWIINGSTSLAFGIILLVTVINKDEIFGDEAIVPLENKCMAWAQNHYEEVSCDITLHKTYGTKVEPYDAKLVANFKKINVSMATDFFAPITNKPLIWYVKNKEGEIEYFTSPGLHPITGKTLDEITSYIIQKYVPLHSENVNSFVN